MATNNNFFGHNVSEEMQQKQAQRVKQSQKLLKKLYHDELNPAYSAPVVKGLKIIVVVSIVTIMVFSSLVTLKYNNFIAMLEEVKAKQSMLEAAIQRRHNLFGNLAQLTMNHAVLEDIVFTHVADSRKEFVDKLNLNEEQKNKLLNINDNPTKEISPIEGIVSALSASGQSPLGQMFALAEQFPDIKSVETYQHMMTQMVEIEDRINMRRQELLAKVQFYNTEIQRFPWYYLAKITGFDHIDYFKADSASHQSPVISYDNFELLMPLKIENVRPGSNGKNNIH